MSKSDNEIERDVPVLFDVKSPLNLANINPAGLEENPELKEALDNALQAKDKYAQDLEDRYKNPNWFKIAAGFAKPQLGGFTASLGSAAEAAGDWIEKQRAIAPTISRMRAETEAQRYALTQRNIQQKLFDQWQASGGKDLTLAGKIYNLDPTSSAAQAVKGSLDAAHSQAATQSTAQQTSAREQELMATKPYYIPINQDLQQGWKAHADKQNEAFKKGLLESGLYSPEQVASFTPAQLQNRYDQVAQQQAEKRLTDAKTSGDVLANSMTTLSNLREARELAHTPEMEKLLGNGSGQDAVSALIGYITHNDEGSYNKLGSAVAKLSQKEPDLYAKFLILQKALNTNVAQARELVQNPSNQATGLLQATYPNVAMPQKAIVNLLDLMAAQNINDARIAALRQSEKYRNVNPNFFESSNEFNAIKKQLEQHKSDIVNNKYYGQDLPSDFYAHENIFKFPEVKAPSSEAYKPPKGWHKEGNRFVRD